MDNHFPTFRSNLMLFSSRAHRSKEHSQPNSVAVSTASKSVVITKLCILLKAVIVFHANRKGYKVYTEYSYNKSNEKRQFLKFIFVIGLYMFRTVSLSTIRSLTLYTQ